MPWPSLARVGEVLHHRHQAEHRADDAERRRVDAHAFENFRGARVGLLAHVQVDFEDAANHVGLAAVDHQLQALAHEVVRFALDERLQAEQALLARGVAPLDHLLDQLVALHRRRLEDPRQDAHRALHHLERRLHEDRRDGADDDDHERRGGQQSLDAGALQHCADEDRDGREDQTE